MKASAMTDRCPNAVRRLTWGLRGIAPSGVSMVETGAAGARWPWRLTALFTLTVTAAVSVALLPAAVARRHRR